MDEKSLKPQLRFKGFADAWEQRKLSEIASYLPSNLSASNTDINGRFDLYDANGVIGKTNAMPQKESYITIIKDGSGVGRVRMLPPQTCYIGTMGGIFSKATNNIDFIFHTLSNFDFSTHIIGATIPHVYFSDYGNDEIGVPYETEQKMIGKFFSNLDNLITLHQRKLDKLSNVKKALLEKMFPKNDSDVPEIRFKGFTDAWEQRKLEDILTQRIEHQKISADAPLLAFSYSEGVIEPEDKKSNKRDFIMTDKYNKIFSRTEKDDIIYNPANVIHGAIHRNKLRTGVVSPIYKIFKCENVSPKFVGECLHRDKFIEEIIKYIEGTVIKLRTLSPEQFLNMSIKIPILYEEQEKIGTVFSSLDNLITLHQRKLEKLKNIKKACLEKMFV